jgi:hypothetical protein
MGGWGDLDDDGGGGGADQDGNAPRDISAPLLCKEWSLVKFGRGGEDDLLYSGCVLP